jgi:ribosomal protein S18 acetylase RimI-like enzyme
MATVRAASASDGDFLRQMLVMAADWRPGPRRLTVADVLAEPMLAHYVFGWPRAGDFGVIADGDSGLPIGAAWCRLFPADDPGYGFVAVDVPEVSIGVVEEARGAGVGRRLMEDLVAAAGERGVARLSLSVEIDNPARGLYDRLGFVEVHHGGGSLTMVLDV